MRRAGRPLCGRSVWVSAPCGPFTNRTSPSPWGGVLTAHIAWCGREFFLLRALSRGGSSVPVVVVAVRRWCGWRGGLHGRRAGQPVVVVAPLCCSVAFAALAVWQFTGWDRRRGVAVVFGRTGWSLPVVPGASVRPTSPRNLHSNTLWCSLAPRFVRSFVLLSPLFPLLLLGSLAAGPLVVVVVLLSLSVPPPHGREVKKKSTTGTECTLFCRGCGGWRATPSCPPKAPSGLW